MSLNSLLPGWLPTEAPEGARYAGNRTCIECHTEQSSALHTAMAKALRPAAECEILRTHGRLTFAAGPYRYEIRREGDRSIYRVTNGEEMITEPILWCFGQGKAGQTYVFQHNGRLYESRVSFYLKIGGLDLTLGSPPGEIPRSLEAAAGRLMNPTDARGCFGCHSTGAVRGLAVDPSQLIPGITCEGCHGPGEKHVEAVRAPGLEDLQINSLKDMTAEEEVNFCGSCHRTWEQVMLMGVQGVNNVRFQPYRLVNSRCYDTADPRIACSACHDPHEDPVADAAYYDAKCLACHASRQAPADAGSEEQAACPVGSEQCSSCHMPNYKIPGAHFQFTDHQIRIVRAGDPYPN